MAEDVWNPDRYDRFRDERRRPFFDLLALVRPRPGMRVVDLGCGSGELTAELHRDVRAADTLGLDSSAAMLAKSDAFAAEGLRFARGDIADFAAGPSYDLVFSNAALQWLPEHDTLFARLTAALAPGGQLAVQMPANYDHPSHTVAAEVATEPSFAAALGGYTHAARAVHPPEEYARILDRLGYAEQHVRLQVYGPHLASREDVVAWTSGTLLTDYERRLSPDDYARFVARYRERLMPRLEDTRPYFFTFKRLLLWGVR
jgi:trans-aconitate 2-methyltransferase